MSKRKNPVSLCHYREAGYRPEALLNYLCMMGWTMPDGREQFTPDEMAACFEWQQVNLGGPVFDTQKLNWLNGRYLREDYTPEQLLVALKEHLFSDERLLTMLPLVHERMDRLDEFMLTPGEFDEQIDEGASDEFPISTHQT